MLGAEHAAAAALNAQDAKLLLALLTPAAIASNG
jgi:hypothetical protein